MRALLIAATLAGALASPLNPQGAQSPGEGGNKAPVFSAASRLVVLHVNVQDRRGGFITDLPAEAFAVFEENRPQRVAMFSSEDGPVAVGLVIDDSSSMMFRQQLVVEAAVAFARSARPNDELFALAFNEDVRPVLDPAAPFTSDATMFEAALSRTIIARGRTAFFDAVVDGIGYLAGARHQRKVLVIIGDGGDNESERSFDEVLRRAQASNVLMYAVALVDPVDNEANPKRLEQLARATGGVVFTPSTRESVHDVLQRIAVDIHHTYTLGYEPDRPADGALRKVTVRVAAPRGVRTVVRTRSAYLAAVTDASRAPHVSAD